MNHTLELCSRDIILRPKVDIRSIKPFWIGLTFVTHWPPLARLYPNWKLWNICNEMNKYTHTYLYRNDLFLNIVFDCLKKKVYYIHVHYTHENDIINELIISIFPCILLQTAECLVEGASGYTRSREHGPSRLLPRSPRRKHVHWAQLAGGSSVSEIYVTIWQHLY